MELKRFVLFVILSLAILTGWQRWVAPRLMPHPAPSAQQSAIAANGTSATGTAAGATPSTAAAQGSAAANLGDKLIKGSRVRIKTDLIDAEIDTMGADLRRVALLKEGKADNPKQPYVLMEDSPSRTYVAQTGLIDGSIANLPTHRTLFTTAAAGTLTMAPGQDSVSVRFEAAPVGGVKVAKIYTFKRDSYLIDVRYEISNGSAAPLTASAYYSLFRDGKAPKGPTGRFTRGGFYGPAVYTSQGKFKEVNFKDLDKGDDNTLDYPKTGHDGWVAMVQHYFVSAWLVSPNGGPNVCAKTTCRYEVQATGNGFYRASAIVPLPAVAPGATSSVTVPIYAGPEDADRLQAAAPGFELARDYGYTRVLAEPLFWMLSQIHKLVGNWGWAIISLTLLIKVALLPLATASYRSMAKMKQLAPRMKHLKEKYGEDRLKFQQATMELYKQEKVNPLGGCLPLLLQMPVFFAFYATLRSAVELRQAGWIFWIHDLSLPDPYYVLPLLMAGSMYLQTFLNPSTGDPMQDRMQKLMPLMFSFMFFVLPSGLVLYQVTQSLSSMAQQWVITRKILNTTSLKRA